MTSIIGQVPPSSNTGAQNTSGTDLIALLDWLQVTLKDVQNLSEIFTILGIPEDEFGEETTGNYGYKSCKRLGHISVYYNGRADMGYHIEMTGQGCREYENYVGDWISLLDRLLSKNAKFSRLDLAIDDHEGYFKLSTIVKKIKKGHIRTLYKKGRHVETIRFGDGENLGRTIYYGSPTSRIQIRMYEKDKEQVHDKGNELKEGIEFWNRTEIQLRDERAQAVAVIIRENEKDLGQIILGVLSSYINFIDENKEDDNKARWKISKFWIKFLNDVEKLKLTQKAPERTIERIDNWIEKQVEPSLALLFLAYKDIGKIIQKIENGMERLTDRDFKLLDLYEKERILREIKKRDNQE